MKAENNSTAANDENVNKKVINRQHVTLVPTP